MIDPFAITDYNRNQNELEEFLLFCILVANKRADYTAKKLQLILERLCADKSGFVFDAKIHSPFDLFQHFSCRDNEEILKEAGIGCYRHKARTITETCQWAQREGDLFTCEPSELETIYGIGRKTSRYFILHTRKGARYAAIDTHLLKFLKEKGVKVPISTPTSQKEYERLEEEFLLLVPPNKSIAEFDLEIWAKYTVSKK